MYVASSVNSSAHARQSLVRPASCATAMKLSCARCSSSRVHVAMDPSCQTAFTSCRWWTGSCNKYRAERLDREVFAVAAVAGTAPLVGRDAVEATGELLARCLQLDRDLHRILFAVGLVDRTRVLVP